MDWRDRLRVSVSRGETDVFLELDRRGLTRGLFTQYPVEFDPEEDWVHGTWIDFAWPDLKYAAFLDGIAKGKRGHPKLHLTLNQSRRDERVDKALERRAWTVQRYPYKIPLRKGRLKEVCDEIEAWLKKIS